MKYIVTVGLLKPGTKEVLTKWDPVEVEAPEKWDALVFAVEGLGVSKGIQMSEFWKGSSIKIKNKKQTKEIRYQDRLVRVKKVN